MFLIIIIELLGGHIGRMLALRVEGPLQLSQIHQFLITFVTAMANINDNFKT